MTEHVSRMISRFSSVYGREITTGLVSEYELVLSDSPPVLVNAATDELLGTSQWFPKPAEVLSAVKRLQAEANPKPAEPEHWRGTTCRCLTCNDTGWVTCWHPASMVSAILVVRGQVPRDKLRLADCAAKCPCDLGQRKGGYASTFGPRWIAIDKRKTADEQIGDLLDWAANLPGRRVEELDQFNEWNSIP